MSDLCIIVTIVGYLAAMLLVGFAYSKSNNNSTDFYLGGRKMGPLVTAMSAEASGGKRVSRVSSRYFSINATASGSSLTRPR